MPVAAGTTSRQLGWLGQTALLALGLLAPLTLWWPSLTGWAVLLGTSLTLGIVWLCWRTVSRQRRIAGNWIHLGLAMNILLSAGHAIISGIRGGKVEASALGQVDISLMLQWAMLALLTLLVQDFLSQRKTPGTLLTMLGLAQVIGSLIAMWSLDAAADKLPVAMMGWAGVGLWVAGRIWPDGEMVWLVETPPPHPGKWRSRLFGSHRQRLVLVAVILISRRCPASLVLATGAAGAMLLLAGMLQSTSRLARLLGGVSLILLAGWTSTQFVWPSPPCLPDGLTGWLGQGDIGLVNCPAGLTMLARMSGWLGVLSLAGVMLVSVVSALYSTRHQSLNDQSAAILLGFAAASAAAALFCPGGLFNPAINATLALTWALLPSAYGGPKGRRSGLWLVCLALGLSVVLGLARHDGLLYWSAVTLGLDDSALHLALGWLTTQMLLWWLGRRWQGGVLAVLISLAASGAGEWAQRSFTTYRLAEWRDFASHTVGALGAVMLYILCMASRAGESDDVRS